MSNGWVTRWASKAGLLAAGIAIGFVWGRAPSWFASDIERDRASGAVPASSSSAPVSPAGPSMPDPAASNAAHHRSAALSTSPAAALPSSSGEATRVAGASDAEREGPHPSTPPRAAGTARKAPSVEGSTSKPLTANALGPNADALAFAIAQLRKAQLFLRADEPARALEALDELDARAPRTLLRDEREVTRALAWCQHGETAKAAALAAHVLERSADSAYAVSLRESCAGREQVLNQMRDRTSNEAR